MRPLAFLPAALPLLFLAACSANVAPAGPGPDPAPTPPDPNACTRAWQTVVPRHTDDGPGPTDIAWHEGALYYASASEGVHALRAIPDTGGTPRVVASEVGPEQLWAEKDALVYAYGDVFASVPYAGGEPATVGDGATVGKTIGDFVAAHALDSEAFYWVQWAPAPFGSGSGSGPSRWTIWSMPRAGGAPRDIGSKFSDASVPPVGVSLIGDNVVVAWSSGNADAYPKSGAHAPQYLSVSPGTTFLGHDDAGLLYGVPVPPNGAQRGSAIEHVDLLDGMPLPFWSSAPAAFEPSRIVPSAAGLVAVGTEPGPDGALRSVVYVLDRRATSGRLVGCGNDDGVLASATTSPDAVFLVFSHAGTGPAQPESWSLVRVPL